jgi:putative transposase
MARLPRLGVAGWPHLVVQRVHEGQLLARDASDRQALMDVLKSLAREHDVAVHAYVLAADHLCLLLTPASAESLSLLMQGLGRRYVAAYNRRHGRQGSLWSGRYRATVLDPAQYLLDAMVFVESPAWQGGERAVLDESVCASARHHLGLGTDPLVTDHAQFWALGNTPFEREAAWRKRLTDGLSARQTEALAQAMHKGWALMSDELAHGVAQTVGRRLSPRPRGRPRKQPALLG